MQKSSYEKLHNLTYMIKHTRLKSQSAIYWLKTVSEMFDSSRHSNTASALV